MRPLLLSIISSLLIVARVFSLVSTQHGTRALPFAAGLTPIPRCKGFCLQIAAHSGDAGSLTLYGHPGTRSPLVNWACHELGVDLTMGDLQKNPHPFGQIPCLTDRRKGEDVAVFESGAILAYLIQNYSQYSESDRASILSWIVWANASLDPICFLETPDGKVYDTGLKQPNNRIDRLERLLLLQQGVLVPNAGFSVADVAVASYLLYVVQFFPKVDLSSRWPTIVNYMKEAASRPAYGESFGQDVQAYLVDKLSATPSDKKKKFGMF